MLRLITLLPICALVFASGCQAVRRPNLGTDTKVSPQRLAEESPGVLAAETEAPTGKVLRLRVLSQATGEHLQRIEVLSAGKFVCGFNMRLLPDPFNAHEQYTIVENGTSPIEIIPASDEADAISLTYFVRSPGFAWKRIHVNAAQGGEREIRLDPAGDLQVQLTGDRLGIAGQLSIRHAGVEQGGFVLSRQTRGQRSYSFQDVPTGQFQATFKASRPDAPSEVIGNVEFEVLQGAQTSIAIKLRELPARDSKRYPLTGTILVPPAWNEDSFYVSCRRAEQAPGGSSWSSASNRGELVLLDKTEGLWSFDFGLEPAGINRIRLFGDAIDFMWPVTVGIGAPNSHALKLPPPADVRVRFVDSTGALIRDSANVHWTPEPSKHAWGQSVPPDPVSGEYEFRATVGSIDLQIQEGDYVGFRQSVSIQPGLNDLTFVRTAGCRLAVRLFDGTTPVPLSSELHLQHLTRADAELRTCFSMKWMGIPSEETLAGAGRYSIQVDPIDGFLPIPTQYVDLATGERTEHIIQLTRAR